MAQYASFDPGDPLAVEYLKWVLANSNPQITAWSMDQTRETRDISSAFSPYREYIHMGPTDVEITLTFVGRLDPNAQFVVQSDPHEIGCTLGKVHAGDCCSPPVKALPS